MQALPILTVAPLPTHSVEYGQSFAAPTSFLCLSPATVSGEAPVAGVEALWSLAMTKPTKTCQERKLIEALTGYLPTTPDCSRRAVFTRRGLPVCAKCAYQCDDAFGRESGPQLVGASVLVLAALVRGNA